MYTQISMFFVPGKERLISTTAGGVIILDEFTMRLFGEVSKAYELSTSITVNRFTRLKCMVEIVSSWSELSICIFETETDLALYAQDQCHTVSVSGEVYINAGQLMNYRTVDVRFFTIRQKVTTASMPAETLISTLSFYSGINTSILDENGICRDPNAETVVRGNEVTCKCIGAFVSSNGGKIQGALDSCIPCSSSQSCAFEGDKCFVDSECVWDSCVDGRCAHFEVSSYNTEELYSSSISLFLLVLF